MKRKVQLSGIIDSYQVVGKKKPSLIIPILMTLIFVGMVIFFFTGKEKPNGKEKTALNQSEQSQPREELPLLDPEPVVYSNTTTKKTNPDSEIPRAILVDDPSFHGKFTTWMSISDLDATIKLMNVGHKKTFWQRGHWITAAEGRWHEGTLEFRIAWEKIPEHSKVLWQYRLNQSQEEFARSIDTFLNQGYKLAYSQSFERPDHTLRFQGIWQKRQIQSTATNEAVAIGNVPPLQTTHPGIIAQKALSYTSNLRENPTTHKKKQIPPRAASLSPKPEASKIKSATTTVSSSSSENKSLNLSDVLSFRGQP